MYIDIWPFYGEIKFAFVWALYICMEFFFKNFKRLLLRSLWAKVTQISCRASLGQGNKIVKMVVVHWPRWLPCHYMVKTFIEDIRSTEIAKLMVLRWRLTLRQGQICFPVHLYGLYTFTREKCWEFIFWIQLNQNLMVSIRRLEDKMSR